MPCSVCADASHKLALACLAWQDCSLFLPLCFALHRNAWFTYLSCLNDGAKPKDCPPCNRIRLASHARAQSQRNFTHQQLCEMQAVSASSCAWFVCLQVIEPVSSHVLELVSTGSDRLADYGSDRTYNIFQCLANINLPRVIQYACSAEEALPRRRQVSSPCGATQHARSISLSNDCSAVIQQCWHESISLVQGNELLHAGAAYNLKYIHQHFSYCLFAHTQLHSKASAPQQLEVACETHHPRCLSVTFPAAAANHHVHLCEQDAGLLQLQQAAQWGQRMPQNAVTSDGCM